MLRPTFETVLTAILLNRRPQTLRLWASSGQGPIAPIRINGNGSRLQWRRRDIEKLLGVELTEEDIRAAVKDGWQPSMKTAAARLIRCVESFRTFLIVSMTINRKE